jgi:5-methylthioadenosine/S-adenosylhomocysteine deaminase
MNFCKEVHFLYKYSIIELGDTMIKVIKNGNILTMENENMINGDIVIENNIIREVVESYAGPYDELIDAKGNIVMPGLINTHTHLGMYNFRNTTDDLKLMDWLNKKIWPIENNMTGDDVEEATYLSCIEMIKTGTTCCADQYFFPFEGIEAVKKSKIRCLYTKCLIDNDGKGEERFEEFKGYMRKRKKKMN